MSKTPTKRRLENVDEDEHIKITPPKSSKLSDAESPSPSRLSYQMNALDAALDHYFSPKKKSPGRSPARSAQRKLHFVSEGSDEENASSSEDNPTKLGRAQRKLEFEGEYDHKSVKQCFQNLDRFLWRGTQQLSKEVIDSFPKWLALLQSGEFNILVHGLGSKRKMLESFREYVNKGFHLLVFDGLDQNASIQSILERIGEEFHLETTRRRKCGLDKCTTALAEKVDAKLGGAGRKRKMLILLLHNIDSPQLRPRAQQEALSILAGSKTIRIVASVDHVNAALLWDQSLRDAFKWLYFPLSTLHCYGQEVLEGSGKLLGLNSKKNVQRHTLESLDMIWEAITSNMRKILEQLNIHAPMHSERTRRDALSIPKFCQILREEFATTSETMLRQQLIEFRDHKLVQLDRDENIQLSVDRQLLSAFLDMKLGSN